jgi:hypothetical protein
MNLKGYGRKRSLPNLRYNPSFACREWGKPRKTAVSKLSSGRDMSSGPPKYEAGLLISQPRRAVQRRRFFMTTKQLKQVSVMTQNVLSLNYTGRYVTVEFYFNLLQFTILYFTISEKYIYLWWKSCWKIYIRFDTLCIIYRCDTHSDRFMN